MYWAALLLDCEPGTAPSPDALQGLGLWALQFTSRVARLDEAVVLEVQASLRLFGGRAALRERVCGESAELGVGRVAWAPTSLAALALARAGLEDGFMAPLAEVLDALPLSTLSAARPHEPVLARLGCRNLGDLRRLPRGGIGRRFDAQLLQALDQAYGLRPAAHAWVPLPDTFTARLELPWRVELAPALMAGARRLLAQLCGWLAARHSGVRTFTLGWAHDAMRSKAAGEGGSLTLRTGAATRHLEHLARLLGEHLAKTELLAPVGDLTLLADEVEPLHEASASLLPDTPRSGEGLREVLERIAARLGPQAVLRAVLAQDHRLEWMQQWQPATEQPPSKPGAAAGVPQPTWVLPEPLRLAERDHRPLYQGPLQLLAGPHRIEGGWWHRLDTAQGQSTGHVQRDYWVAASEHAGVLWIFQQRLGHEDTAWYLHGIFA